MSGRLISRVKYIYLHNDNDLKSKSLEDNVYFTIIDIFWNTEKMSYIAKGNRIIEQLTNGVHYEERDENFEYSNILNEDIEYTTNLCEWLQTIYDNNNLFYFTPLEEDEIDDMTAYMLYDDWLTQLRNLIEELKYNTELNPYPDEDAMEYEERLKQVIKKRENK